MSISTYLEGKLLDLVLSNTSFAAIAAVFGSLHTADPTETGTGSPLASCPRVAVVFNVQAGSSAVNATTVDWLTSASGVISHLGLWDGSATATANHLWNGALATTKAVNVGDTIRAASGSISVTLE